MYDQQIEELTTELETAFAARGEKLPNVKSIGDLYKIIVTSLLFGEHDTSKHAEMLIRMIIESTRGETTTLENYFSK